MRNASLSILVGLGFAGLTACGPAGEHDGEVDTELGGDPASELDWTFEDGPPGDVSEVEQEYGEASCATTTADDSFVWNSGVTSGNSTYDHATCRFSYIATTQADPIPGSPSYDARAQYDGPVPDGVTYPCPGAWVRLTAWKKETQPNAPWVKQGASATTYGVPLSTGPGCFFPPASVQLDTPGVGATVKIVAQAGYATGFTKVHAYTELSH